MFEEILTQQNSHWTEPPSKIGVERSCFSTLMEYVATGQIVAITGVRRSGKSTLLKQLIYYLIKKEKIPSKNILFFNLEHPYLSPYSDNPTTLQLLYEDYLKIAQPKGKIYILLDEVQFFRQWPVFVKAHFETKNIQFVVTGSNAIMLSSDMITLLSGRSLALEVFPFSLREFASSQDIDITKPLTAAKQTIQIKNLFEELLEYGGFPQIVLSKNKKTAFDILGAHAKTVLLQDVAPRLHARKPTDLEKLYVYLVSNIGKLFSYAGLSKLFGLADKSIKEYIQAFIDSYLIYELDQFSFSLKKQIRSQKKIYAIDTGQANAMGFKFTANRGRLLENLILIELKRLGLDLYYFSSKAEKEIDFVIKDKNEICLMQVTWHLNDPTTYKREVNALREGMEELKCKKAFIIVADPLLSSEEIEDGITILQAYQFLTFDQGKQKEILFSS